MLRRLPLLGAIAIGLGFVVIAVSWWAAHGRSYVDEQFPALVAGTVFGLGLVVLGGLALGIAAHHHATDRLAAHLSELLGTRPDPEASEHDEPELAVFDQDHGVVEPALRLVAKNGTNGSHGSDSSGGTNGGAATYVIPRRTLFHDPGCRLVTSREGTDVIERSDAVAAGLAACRVCRP